MPTRRKTTRPPTPAASFAPIPLPAEPDLASLLHAIETNLDGDLSVAALAHRAGMSTSCFSRWFRVQTGMTPHSYVVDARVERAKALLQSSQLPLLEIALSAGFSSQPCLNVTFRRRVGMTPTDYRRQVSTKAKDEADTGERESTVRARRRSLAS